MGKSNTIQEQQKVNQEFQKYIEEMTKNMEQRQNALSGQLDEMEKSHYEKFSDKALLVEGKYSHLTTVSEWSLKSVNAIIDACTKALFGDKKTPPEGSQLPETDEQTSESIKAIKGREAYIASEAFEVVQAIVGTFSSTTTTSVEQKVDAKPIAPGMTMFIGVENNAYTSSSFLKSEKIIQTLFVFKVCYSIAEGKQQSALSDLQMYEDQKQRFREIINQLGDKEMELDIDDPDYDEKFNKLADRVELMTKRMDVITQKIGELTNLKLEEDKMACRQLVEHMQAKRLAVSCARNGSEQTSTGFNCTLTKYEIENRIRANTPRTAHLVCVHNTDWVGNHFEAIFSSDNSLNQAQVDRWVQSALTGKGNFYFD